MSWIPIKDVAKKYGKTVTQIRYAIKQKRLPGTKIGWGWFCDSKQLPDRWPKTKHRREGVKSIE